MTIVTFLRKNGVTKNRLLIFFGKTHSDTKSWKLSRISMKKSYNNNGKHLKSYRILRVKPIFFIFLHFPSIFIVFLHFAPFFFMFVFSFLFISPFSVFFLFLFLFLMFFLFSFFFLSARNLIFFWPRLLHDFPSRPLLLVLPDTFSYFVFSFFVCFFNLCLYFFQICFVAGISIRVSLFPP